MKNFKLTGLAALLGLVVAGCLPASVVETVFGYTNVFLAGQAPTAGCSTSSAGCAPTAAGNLGEVDFIPVAGNVLNFGAGTGITGGVSPCPTCGSTTSGDGLNFGSAPPATSITSGNNISGIQFTGMEMFLIGVFLGPGLPAAPVASAGDFAAGAYFASPAYTPLVGQAFFIGDGLTGTGTGTVQTWIVPSGATRLFLGFADAPSFIGMAYMYADNTGSLPFNLQIGPAPEPGTVVLMIVGLAALMLGRKKLMA